MYEKHIAALEELRTCNYCGGCSEYESLATAIDLMRAAEPKDAEAELLSFRRVAAEIMADEHDTSENIVDALFRASAAARAEGVRSEAEFEVLQTELSAAKAEIERLCALQQALCVELNGKLLLEVDFDSVVAQRDALETKLTNLRAAAKRSALQSRDAGLLLAIEESL